MIRFLAENIGTVIVAALLLAVVFFAVRSIIVSRKKGKCTCGCDCGSCAMSGTCHEKPKDVSGK